MPSPDLLASSVPRVGIAVFILHPTVPASSPTSPPLYSKKYKFLLGKRLGSHGAGTWALPGGHLEFGESFEECAAREVLEETVLELDIDSVEYLTATNDVMPYETAPSKAKEEGSVRGKHYVTIFMTARVKAADWQAETMGMPEAELLEPEKCAGWEWVSWEELLRWSRPQMQACALPYTSKEKNESEGEVEGEGKEELRKLFSPMISLLVQRPDAVPRLI